MSATLGAEQLAVQLGAGVPVIQAPGRVFPFRLQYTLRQLDEVAPAFLSLPHGRKRRINYQAGKPPSVASRLQDFIGLKQSPTVAKGRVRLLMELLAPGGWPVQVTTDLESFWRNLYPQLRRELSRRYPRHLWPETPGS